MLLGVQRSIFLPEATVGSTRCPLFLTVLSILKCPGHALLHTRTLQKLSLIIWELSDWKVPKVEEAKKEGEIKETRISRLHFFRLLSHPLVSALLCTVHEEDSHAALGTNVL
jgi:hypothetical protein